MLKRLCVLVMIASSVAYAGDSRVPEQIVLKVDGVPNDVWYNVMKPKSATAGKLWPLLIVIPGSHSPEKDTVDDNEGRRRVMFWAYIGTEDFFVISVCYGNNNDAYPHNEKRNGIRITDAMIRDAIKRFPIDPSRIFIQSFSRGGVFMKPFMDEYAKNPPVVFAGMLFTDANCWGVNVNAACVTENTFIFIATGSKDCPPYEPWDCVKEAVKWKSIFTARCKDVEHHVIEGQGHTIGPEQQELIKKWFSRVLKEIESRAINAITGNLKPATELVSKGKFGDALVLIEGAMNINAPDNADIVKARQLAEILIACRERLKKEYEAGITETPEEAFAALLAIERLFRGHPFETMAKDEIATRKKEKGMSGHVIRAGKRLKSVIDRETAAVNEALKP